MASKAREEDLRGKGSAAQDPSERTAEGLGGVNICGFEDPRTATDLPNAGEAKSSDPEWVHRVDPEKVPKYMTKSNNEVAGNFAGEGVGYDPASATVAGTEVAPQSSGASDSQTGLLPRSHELGGRGGPESLGAAGADFYAGSAGTGAGPKMRHRASAGADYLDNREDVGKSTKTRAKAGTEGGVQGEEMHQGFDVTPPASSLAIFLLNV